MTRLASYLPDRPEERFIYRDHEIILSREAGTVYHAIFDPEGYEVHCSFTVGWEDRWPTIVKCFKERVDNELAEDDPWGKKAELESGK